MSALRISRPTKLCRQKQYVQSVEITSNSPRMQNKLRIADSISLKRWYWKRKKFRKQACKLAQRQENAICSAQRISEKMARIRNPSRRKCREHSFTGVRVLYHDDRVRVNVVITKNLQQSHTGVRNWLFAVKADMESQRSFNRISPKRETQQRRRGFDPITNQSFEGFNRKHLHPPRKTDSPPLWMKLKNQSSDRKNVRVPRLNLIG